MLQLIGGTPLVSLGRLAPPGSTVVAKCEQQNPGGSVKDRIALGMIEAAEAAGRIRRKLAAEPPGPKARFVGLRVSETGFQVTRS